MNIKRFSWQSAICLLISLTVTLFLLSSQSEAEDIPVATNIPTTLTADISAGMEITEIPFELGGADGVIIETIVPVDGASFQHY